MIWRGRLDRNDHPVVTRMHTARNATEDALTLSQHAKTAVPNDSSYPLRHVDTIPRVATLAYEGNEGPVSAATVLEWHDLPP
jgi:hypothetical protein